MRIQLTPIGHTGMYSSAEIGVSLEAHVGACRATVTLARPMAYFCISSSTPTGVTAEIWFEENTNIS